MDGRVKPSSQPMAQRCRSRTRRRSKPGDKIADWDPFAQPMIAEVEGTIRLVDIVDGLTAREETDEATGISSRVIIDGRGSKGADLRPSIMVVNDKGEPMALPNGNEARYMLSPGAILSVDEGDTIKVGESMARVATGGAKTKDITGGLPRVAELFEARRPKDHAVIAEMDGRIQFIREYKQKRKIAIVPEEEGKDAIEFLVPKARRLDVQDGDYVKRGDYIIDGNPAPQDILATLGIEALANYLVDEVQKVYRLQGVPINDKHIEVIVRQMLQKFEITDAGTTTLIKGEHVDGLELEEANAAVRKSKKSRPARSGWSSGLARHHQSFTADPQLHLSRFVPGNDAGADRSGAARQSRYARRLERKRHCWTSHSGRYWRRHARNAPRLQPSAINSFATSVKRPQKKRQRHCLHRKRLSKSADPLKLKAPRSGLSAALFSCSAESDYHSRNGFGD